MDIKKETQADRWFSIAVLAVVFAVATGLFMNSLHGGFVYDDHFIVEKEPLIRELSFTNFLRHFTYTGQTHFLPIRIFSYTVDHAIWGMKPFGFHLTNILLHALNAMLVCAAAAMVFARGSGMKARTAWLAGGAAALLFCSHPIQVESVAWISGRKDVLSTFFLLCSFVLYLKTFFSPADSRRGNMPIYAAFILFFPAMFSKATVLGFPLVLAAAEFFLKPGEGREKTSSRVERLLPFFIATAAILTLDVVLSQKSGIITGYFGGSVFNHYLTIMRIPFLYLKNILWPFHLCPEYSYTPAKSLFSAAALLPLGGLAALLGVFFYFARRDRVAAFFMAWAAFNLAPVMNILPTSKLIADRYAYLPSIGFFALVAYLIFKWAARAGKAAAAVAILLVVCVSAGLGYMSVQRNLLWHSDFALWSNAFQQEPENAVVLHQLGFAYYEKGDKVTARRLLEKALKKAPNDVSAMVNLGAIEYEENGNTDLALNYFKKATELEPRRMQGWVNLFILYLEREMFEEARQACLSAIAQDPYNQAHYDRMQILISRAKEKGVELKPLVPPATVPDH